MPPAAARNLFRQLGREVRAVARQGQLIAAARNRATPSIPGERVVVFVHGFMAAGPVFDPMRAFVEQRAPVGTVDITYGPLERFDRAVDRLASIVDRVAEGRRVDIVGHSLGGIVARWYLQERGGAAHVDRLVTLASPHAGTRAARVAMGPLVAGSLLEAIRPDSRVIRTLRDGRARASRVIHTAVVAGLDRMVTPPESAASIEDATIHWLHDVGHNEMLFEPRAFAHVHDGLTR
ncbi:esterase/lipase family protein [Sandaracinus amylolyticus]|uniref:esterase/lipase family protein n=1 Tax=Sandaracinus amylolyticus TaxID=927083 RepID=UPI001F3CF8BB|nr:alpha/beta fold hydrolase [Sandaracinus amylolyticus]UJR80276.1 Putative secreted lipase [Sandaracinus amylolyticus]